MILQLDIEPLRTLDEVRDFMAGSVAHVSPCHAENLASFRAKFAGGLRFAERADAYSFVPRVLVRTGMCGCRG